jgi:excisionase family DNA binding protein
MTPPRPVPRLALSPDEAAQSLGVSRDYFDQYIVGELRIVRRGGRKLIPISELEKWLTNASSRALEG